MQGHFAIFRVRAFQTGKTGPEEVVRDVAVWVEGALSVDAGPAPLELAELQKTNTVLAAISAENVAAFVDDLDVPVNE